MSVVTGVVLTHSVCEGTGGVVPAVDAVQAWLRERGMGDLVEVSDHAGGNKGPQIEIYIGGFNYLDEAEFVQVVKRAPWDWPGNVALIVNPEEGPVAVYRLEGPSA